MFWLLWTVEKLLGYLWLLFIIKYIHFCITLNPAVCLRGKSHQVHFPAQGGAGCLSGFQSQNPLWGTFVGFPCQAVTFTVWITGNIVYGLVLETQPLLTDICDGLKPHLLADASQGSRYYIETGAHVLLSLPFYTTPLLTGILAQTLSFFFQILTIKCVLISKHRGREGVHKSTLHSTSKC